MYRQENIAAVFVSLRHEVFVRLVVRHAGVDFAFAVVPKERARDSILETVPATLLNTLPEPAASKIRLVQEFQLAVNERNDAVRLLSLANHKVLAGSGMMLY